MSTIISAACWPLQGMSVSQKAVLISLADQASDDGVCWPAVKSIALRTCLSERAVQDALAWLQTVGIVFREYRANTSTSYTIRPSKYDPSKAPSARQRAAKSTGANGAPPADGAPQKPVGQPSKNPAITHWVLQRSRKRNPSQKRHRSRNWDSCVASWSVSQGTSTGHRWDRAGTNRACPRFSGRIPPDSLRNSWSRPPPPGRNSAATAGEFQNPTLAQSLR